MRYFLYCLLIVFLSVGCSPTTQLTASWKRDEAPKSFKKLSVAALLPNMSSRAIIESAVAGSLRSEGINSKATFDLFPLAGREGLVEKMGLSQEEFRAKVKDKVTKNGIDGLLVITLFDKQQEERYVEGAGFTISGAYPVPYSATGGYSYPVYGYSYYDYYYYSYARISEPGYWKTTTTYFLESNLYDVESGKLIWTGQTTSKDPKSVEKEAEIFGDLIVNELIGKNVVNP